MLFATTSPAATETRPVDVYQPRNGSEGALFAHVDGVSSPLAEGGRGRFQ